jgi:hypothetical protein
MGKAAFGVVWLGEGIERGRDYHGMGHGPERCLGGPDVRITETKIGELAIRKPSLAA